MYRVVRSDMFRLMPIRVAASSTRLRVASPMPGRLLSTRDTVAGPEQDSRETGRREPQRPGLRDDRHGHRADLQDGTGRSVAVVRGEQGQRVAGGKRDGGGEDEEVLRVAVDVAADKRDRVADEGGSQAVGRYTQHVGDINGAVVLRVETHQADALDQEVFREAEDQGFVRYAGEVLLLVEPDRVVFAVGQRAVDTQPAVAEHLQQRDVRGRRGAGK